MPKALVWRGWRAPSSPPRTLLMQVPMVLPRPKAWVKGRRVRLQQGTKGGRALVLAWLSTASKWRRPRAASNHRHPVYPAEMAVAAMAVAATVEEEEGRRGVWREGNRRTTVDRSLLRRGEKMAGWVARRWQAMLARECRRRH